MTSSSRYLQAVILELGEKKSDLEQDLEEMQGKQDEMRT